MVVTNCLCCLCGLDLQLHFRIMRTRFLGLCGPEWPARCHKSEQFSFPSIALGALLFFLFNWLGKEVGSCDVNKENESLPKVKPAVRQSDVLIKWLSSEVDRVTVREGESLRAPGNKMGRQCLSKLPTFRRSAAASAAHSSFLLSYGSIFPVAIILEHSSFHDSAMRSSRDEVSHCGAILTTRSLGAANSLIA